MYFLCICLTQCKWPQTSDHPIASPSHISTIWSYVRMLCLYITVSRCKYLELYNCAEGKACLLSKPSLDKYSNTHRHTISHYVLNGSVWLYFPAYDDAKRVCRRQRAIGSSTALFTEGS